MCQPRQITDTTLIDRFVPTMKEIAEKGGKVVVASHFGRPKGEKKPEFSIAFLAPALEKACGLKVTFIDDCVGEKRDEAVKRALIRHYGVDPERFDTWYDEDESAPFPMKGEWIDGVVFMMIHR